MLRHVLSAFVGESVLLTLDTSMLWAQFCLVEVCVWGGGVPSPWLKSYWSMAVLPLALSNIRACWSVPGTASHAQVTLLADRGFEHGNLIHWLQQQQWSWAIQSDLVTLAHGRSASVEQLVPPAEQAYLFENVRVLDGIDCHLITAGCRVPDPWTVLSDQPPLALALYGKRFGGIEPHFGITVGCLGVATGLRGQTLRQLIHAA